MHRLKPKQLVRDLSNYPYRVGANQIAKCITARQAIKEISNGSRI